MTLQQIIMQTRSFRRFWQAEPIAIETLKELINLARLGGSARNVQPLKYLLVNTPAQNAKIFPHLGWAGYLKDWQGPVEGERPSAYIICLLDTRISNDAECDLGIATQNILLGATEKGLGGCRIASFSRKLQNILDMPNHFQILLVLALGKPKETVLLEDSGPDDNIKYWRDENQVHHVPKRSLEEIIILRQND
jgi:nitroreductase